MSELTETLCPGSDNGRGREARQGLQPGDVRSSLRRAAAGEGAEARGLQPGEVSGACRRGRRRGGLQFYYLRTARGATGQLSDIWLGLWVRVSGGSAQSASMSMHGMV